MHLLRPLGEQVRLHYLTKLHQPPVKYKSCAPSTKAQRPQGPCMSQDPGPSSKADVSLHPSHGCSLLPPFVPRTTQLIVLTAINKGFHLSGRPWAGSFSVNSLTLSSDQLRDSEFPQSKDVCPGSRRRNSGLCDNRPGCVLAVTQALNISAPHRTWAGRMD